MSSICWLQKCLLSGYFIPLFNQTSFPELILTEGMPYVSCNPVSLFCPFPAILVNRITAESTIQHGTRELCLHCLSVCNICMCVCCPWRQEHRCLTENCRRVVGKKQEQGIAVIRMLVCVCVCIYIYLIERDKSGWGIFWMSVTGNYPSTSVD